MNELYEFNKEELDNLNKTTNYVIKYTIDRIEDDIATLINDNREIVNIPIGLLHNIESEQYIVYFDNRYMKFYIFKDEGTNNNQSRFDKLKKKHHEKQET